MQYLVEGGHVYGACRKPAWAERLQGLAQREEGQIDLLAMDVTDSETIALAAASVSGAIDVPINSAGIVDKPRQTTGSLRLHRVGGGVRCQHDGAASGNRSLPRSYRPQRTEAGGGMGSLVENTSGGSIAYRSSKAAVNMALRSTWHRQGSPVHPGRPRLGADRHGWRRRLDLAA